MFDIEYKGGNGVVIATKKATAVIDPKLSLVGLKDASTKEAVEIAKAQTPKGTICLLSTASPSYGMFKNFEEKGESFRACIGE